MKKSLSATKAMWAILFIFILASAGKAQTGQAYLDSLQNGKIKQCLTNYTAMQINPPATALTGIVWQIQNPTWHQVNTSNITLDATNTGPCAFYSDQTGEIDFNFYLVPSPTNPTIPNINKCGDIWAYLGDALNQNIDATYIWWPSGSNFQRDTIITTGIKWVTIDNGCGVAITDSFTVAVNHTNDVNLGGNDTICLYDTLLLSAAGVIDGVSYLWSNGTGDIPYTKVYNEGNYSVTVTDGNGCVSSDVMELIVKIPFNGQEICYIECDSLSLKNNIHLPHHIGVNQDSIEIDQKITSTSFQKIAMIPSSQSSYLVMTSNPLSQSATYGVRSKDACGNISDISPLQTTFVLGIGQFVPDTLGQMMLSFIWADYIGAVVSTYSLYGVLPDGTVVLIASGLLPGSNNQYNWLTTSNPYVQFFIGFWIDCGSKSQHLVRSNPIGGPTGLDEITLNKMINVYPVPTNGPINIETPLVIKEVDVDNILGQCLFTTTKKLFTIEAPGVYLVKIRSSFGTVIKKVVIQ